MSFRPDPNRPRSIDQAIADLTKIAQQLHPSNPRADKIDEMIRGLREYKAERQAAEHRWRRGPRRAQKNG